MVRNRVGQIDRKDQECTDREETGLDWWTEVWTNRQGIGLV